MGCCKKNNLGTHSKLLASLQGLSSFVVFVLGAVVGNNELISKGLGSAPCVAGHIVALLAFANMISAVCGRYGARTHNKFCLLSFSLCQAGCTIVILLILANTLDLANDDVDDAEQIACATKGFNASCSKFFADEKRTKLRNLWKYMYVMSRDTDSEGLRFVQLMEDIQTEGYCCGFEPPFACTFGAASTEEYEIYLHSDINVPDTCGTEAWWYNPTSDCNNVVETGQGLYYPGCPYFLPVGRCKVFGYSFGCVHQLRVYLLYSFVPLFQTVQILSILNILACITALCLFFKRKDHDVLPTTYIVTKRSQPKV